MLFLRRSLRVWLEARQHRFRYAVPGTCTNSSLRERLMLTTRRVRQSSTFSIQKPTSPGNRVPLVGIVYAIISSARRAFVQSYANQELNDSIALDLAAKARETGGLAHISLRAPRASSCSLTAVRASRSKANGRRGTGSSGGGALSSRRAKNLSLWARFYCCKAFSSRTQDSFARVCVRTASFSASETTLAIRPLSSSEPGRKISRI
jgi:hypothetical protein